MDSGILGVVVKPDFDFVHLTCFVFGLFLNNSHLGDLDDFVVCHVFLETVFLEDEAIWVAPNTAFVHNDVQASQLVPVYELELVLALKQAVDGDFMVAGCSIAMPFKFHFVEPVLYYDAVASTDEPQPLSIEGFLAVPEVNWKVEAISFEEFKLVRVCPARAVGVLTGLDVPFWTHFDRAAIGGNWAHVFKVTKVEAAFCVCGQVTAQMTLSSMFQSNLYFFLDLRFTIFAQQ